VTEAQPERPPEDEGSAWTAGPHWTSGRHWASGPQWAVGPWIPAVAFLLGAGLAGAFHAHARFVNDDALITIRYAENLVAGHGLVYNAGEHTLGTTTPLWALILAAFHWVGASLPGTSALLGVLAFGWATTAATLFVRARREPWTAQCLTACLVATSPLTLRWVGSGMETSLYIALLATFLWAHQRRWMKALGFLGGAMVLVRPDAGLVLAAAAGLEFYRERSWKPLKAVLPWFAVMVVPWLVAATWFYTWFYGSPLPNSGFAKRLQVEDWGAFLPQFLGNLALLGPLAFFGLLGLVDQLRTPRRALPALAFLAITFGMAAGGMPACHWYMPPPLFLFLLLAASGAHIVASRIAGPVTTRSISLWIVVLLGALIGHRSLVHEVRDAKRYQASLEAYQGKLGDWLAENAPADASVGIDNLGYIGYRSGLRVVDMRGLIQKDVMEGIAASDKAFGLRKHRPEFITMWVGRSSSPDYAPDQEWFDDNGYRVVFRIPLNEKRQDVAYTIFSRVPDEPR